MKKVYYKPEILVVTVNLKQALLNTSPGPNSDYMDNPTISGGAPTREYKSVWDDDWSN
jgi:hypothetical protein